MKRNLLTPLYLVAVIAIIGMSWSCTKENVSAPAQQTAASPNDEALQAGETITAAVTPGTYTILQFIDTGDDHTSAFTGYTFQFRADGTLVATKNGTSFTGTWRLRKNGTMMAISISGTRALNNLDDDSWNVVKTTTNRIVLQKAGPDKVIFVM